MRARYVRIGAMDFRMALAAFTGAIFLVLGAAQAETQTFTTLHSFTGGADGEAPYAGLSMDRAGNLYGTAAYGGYATNGTVYKLQ